MKRSQKMISLKCNAWVFGHKHCSNDCPHIDIVERYREYSARCQLYDESLLLDNKKKCHPYVRCEECVKNEESELEIEDEVCPLTTTQTTLLPSASTA